MMFILLFNVFTTFRLVHISESYKRYRYNGMVLSLLFYEPARPLEEEIFASHDVRSLALQFV